MRILFAALLLLPCTSLACSAQVAFSPNGGATEAVVQFVGEARRSIHLAGYGFTSSPIAYALVEAHKRGVDVEAVLDKSNKTARYSGATFLANSGIPVRIDSRYPIMHDKFFTVDGKTVETGSFNYTRSAGRNAENVLILRDCPEVVAKYDAEFQRLWSESQEYER